MKEECKKCNLKQVSSLSRLLDLDAQKENELLEFANDYLAQDFNDKTNPEVMGDLYARIIKSLCLDDPYETIKSEYNQFVMEQENAIDDIIAFSDNEFETALKIAIVGNLIDFSAKHRFSKEMLSEKIDRIVNSRLALDHSDLLFKRLGAARSLLYLGDNCGEIVLDKIFIKKIKELFPQLQVTFACRGFPVVNDATMVDVKQVGLDQVCQVIDNGDSSLGTVYHRVSPSFRQLFDEADIIISKGQGNLESLMADCPEKIFFLFMVKCELVGDPLGLEMYDIVCANLSRHLKK
ncbi:MAG: ARMT1-like domain-containing protein [Erysipelotrichaceae bacterium]|nr:ARMT1-like domain-containing protein [Erysipelotrichaceae bacterium]